MTATGLRRPYVPRPTRDDRTAECRRLVDELLVRAGEAGIVVIPAGLCGVDGLPSVRLGPHTGTRLGDYLGIVRGLGARAVYLMDGRAHLDAAAEDDLRPGKLALQCVHDGVLHTWTTGEGSGRN